MKKFWDNSAPCAADTLVRHAARQKRVPASLSIGNVTISPATVLAPMAGVTDTVFRRFIRNLGGCGLIMTEFTSADGVLRKKDQKAKRYLHFYEDEHPISAQLFGSDPYVMAEAARMVEGLGFDLVDLNLGCPAKKVVKCNGGSGLLRDLPAIGRIFESVRAAVSIPFTVKFRAGWNDEEIVCVELARMAEDCGLAAVALHARTREMGYSGYARWEWIAAIKDAVKIPVIGNGDIRSPEDACAMVTQTGCDAVMIGRSAPSNPWIFRQIEQYCAGMREAATVKAHGGAGALARPAERSSTRFDSSCELGEHEPGSPSATPDGGVRGSTNFSNSAKMYDSPSEADRYQMIRTYFQMLIEEELPDAVGKMKQFASWFTHGVPGGAHLRKEIYESKSAPEILVRVENSSKPDYVARASSPAGAKGMDCLRLPAALEASNSVLIAGAGGGFDVYTGLPIYERMRSLGKRAYLANLSFTYLGGTNAKQLTPALYAVDGATTGEDLYFPERALASFLSRRDESVTVYAFDRMGVQAIRDGYRFLVRLLGIDAIVLADGGTDILMRGDEAGLGTPAEDIMSLAAVASLDVPTRVVTCLGFGVDSFHGVCHANWLENVAALTKAGGFLDAIALRKEMPEVQSYIEAVSAAEKQTSQRPSIVNGSIVSALEGRFGDYHRNERPNSSRLFISPLMSILWSFDLALVARHNLYLDRVEETRSIWDVLSVIESFRHEVASRHPESIPY